MARRLKTGNAERDRTEHLILNTFCMDTIQLMAITEKAIEALDAKGTLTGEDLRKHNELCKAYNILKGLND